MRQLRWRDRGRLAKDMALGQRWGQLRIVGYGHRPCGRKQRTYVMCVCLCGGLIFSLPEHLRNREVQSCGCLRAALAKTKRCQQRAAA